MNNIFKNHRLILFLILSALIILGWFGERIPSNNETGWDGKHYAHYVINFPQQLANGEIDSFHFFRLMPSFIVSLLLKLFHYDPNSTNIVHAFLACNTFLILACALYYFSLCNHFKIRKSVETIGFCGLFINFSILKHTFYYPVLTDVFAFAFGFFVVGEFMRKRWLTTFLAFILGTFTYSLFFITSFIFLIRSKSKLIEILRIKIFPYAKWIFPTLMCLMCIIYFFWGNQILPQHYNFNMDSLWIIAGLPTLLIYYFKIFDIKFSFQQSTIIKFTEMKIVISIVIFFAIYFLLNHVIKSFTIPENEVTPLSFFWIIFCQAIDKPFSFLIAHFTYFGPVVLLMIFYYKKIIAEISSLGWQIFLFIFIYLVLGIGSESREFINAWPAFVLVFVLTINKINFNKNHVIAFVIICLFQSHFWLKINRPKIYESYIYDKFPEQFYFMHHGPFASDTSYLINVSSFILFALLFGFMLKKAKPQISQI